jgi:DNA-binding CsgD family transcriptional regulator
MLNDALVAAAERSGWEVVAERGPGETLVTDVAPARLAGHRPGNDAVLVCDPTPFAARCALDAVSNLVAAAVVVSDEADGLAAALDGVLADRVTFSARVLELSARMPHLSERQLAILRAVIAGQSNQEIARGLYLSLASVKREMGFVYVIMGVSGRSALTAQALGLGLTGRPLRP